MLNKRIDIALLFADDVSSARRLGHCLSSGPAPHSLIHIHCHCHCQQIFILPSLHIFTLWKYQLSWNYVSTRMNWIIIWFYLTHTMITSSHLDYGIDMLSSQLKMLFLRTLGTLMHKTFASCSHSYKLNLFDFVNLVMCLLRRSKTNKIIWDEHSTLHQQGL